MPPSPPVSPASTPGFTFDYDPGELRCARGCVADLASVLAARSLADALVVTGTSVGANPDVMDPVEAGLGDRLAGVFAETTPAKTLGTGLEAAERVREAGIDAIVALGSGSSLDVARVASALGSHDDPAAAAERALESGTVSVASEGEATPIVAVPTTLSGADLSVIGGVTLTLETGDVSARDHPSGSVRDRRLMPTALLYDLALFETTPRSVLTASAMNGFDKAIECLYSPHATPITDGTATRGLSLMRAGFPALAATDPDEGRLYRAVAGVVCAQYGISTPGTYRASIVHAFGHGLSHDYPVHQGVAHAVLAPHVLAYVFDRADARRDLIADGLGVADPAASDDDLADAIVDAVAEVRDDLELPTRLRDLDPVSRADLPSIAETVRADGLLEASPVVPTEGEILSVLEAAW